MEQMLDNLKNIYGIKDEEKFNDYANKAKIVLTSGKKPSEDKKLVIVGGQSGSGKSRLIAATSKELENNAVIVDFDELRALHPSYKVVNNIYPEITHQILHPDTEKVKNQVLKFLIQENYNVIYEGALRNTKGFIDFARDFKDNNYNVNMNIMAVPKLESYGSTFLRYAYALITEQTPRWVEKFAHDGSYDGVINTVKAFKNEGLADNINVYVRNEESPKKIYSTSEKQFSDAIVAIQYGREVGRKKAVSDFQGKYHIVKEILQQKQPELVERLSDWENLYNEEKEYFNMLNRYSDNNR